MTSWMTASAAFVVSHVAGAGTVLHVDDDATLGGDGLTWATAYRYLQDALAIAVAGTEIRVAQGIYLPDLDEAGGMTPGDREATFTLAGDVGVLGGWRGAFDGSGMPADDRDVASFVTTLSGDLLGNDGPDFANNDENSYHVLFGEITAGIAVLDGITVNGGNADITTSDVKYGGGFYSIAGDISIINCTFDGNSSFGQGGGLYVIGGLQVQQCTFTDNVSYRGGAMSVGGTITISDCNFVGNKKGGAIRNGGMLTAIRCEFVGNTAPGEGQRVGGGVASYDDALFVDCLFYNNTASNNGGGLYVYNSDATLINCIFDNNESNRGGAAAFWTAGYGFLFNCTLAQNTANSAGGAIKVIGGVELTNCILWANTAASHDQIDPDGVQPPIVAYCDVEGGWSGVGNIDADPLFVDPVAGDFRLLLGSPCIESGRCLGMPADTLDLDGDGDFDEPVPHDFDGAQRIVNTAIDMGPYELQAPPIPPGDLDHDSIVGIADFLQLLASWGPCCQGDLNVDGMVDAADLDVLLTLIGSCPAVGACPADLDGDGVVDPDDAILLAGSFGGCAVCPDDPEATLSSLARTCHADIDQDGVTGIADFLLLLSNWN